MIVRLQDLEVLKETVIRHRCDWPAVFSCNWHHHIFMFRRWGYHREEDRVYVHGQNEFLDAVAAELLRVRDNGGRFFIDHTGAYYKPEGGRGYEQFLEFRIT